MKLSSEGSISSKKSTALTLKILYVCSKTGHIPGSTDLRLKMRLSIRSNVPSNRSIMQWLSVIWMIGMRTCWICPRISREPSIAVTIDPTVLSSAAAAYILLSASSSASSFWFSVFSFPTISWTFFMYEPARRCVSWSATGSISSR